MDPRSRRRAEQSWRAWNRLERWQQAMLKHDRHDLRALGGRSRLVASITWFTTSRPSSCTVALRAETITDDGTFVRDASSRSR